MNRTKMLKPILGLMALATASMAMAWPSSYYHTESVLKSGNWVKVKVTENGIHQFTYDQLRDMGFSDPSKVTVFGYGGTSLSQNVFRSTDPDDLPQLYVLHTSDDRMLFYGEGRSRAGLSSSERYTYDLRVNYYANEGCYFLTDAVSLKPVERVARNSSNSTVVSHHTAVEFIDFDEVNPGYGGAHFFGPSLIQYPDQTQTFMVRDGVPGGKGYVAYLGVCKNQYSNAPSFEMQLGDDVTLADGSNITGNKLSSSISIFGKVNGYQNFKLRQESAPMDLYSVKVSPKNVGSNYDYAAIDWIFFTYQRKNTLGEDAQRRMHFPKLRSYEVMEIDDARANLEVWDVTSPFRIRRFTTYLTPDNKLQCTPDRNYNSSDYPALTVVAFHPSGEFPTPDVVGKVENQSLHSLPTPHMLIITNDECEAEANRLAQAHRDLQGIDVEVVNQKLIFNEFSSGTPDVMAYRRFAKMFYDRDPQKFRSLLLFGRGCYDNRGIALKADDTLLTYQVEDYTHMGTNATNYTSDDYFGMLEDYFSMTNITATQTQIAVGRIPASKADIKPTVDKIIDYLSNPPMRGYRNKALIIADDNDANKHETQSDNVIDTLRYSSPQITCTKVYNNVYPWTDKNDALTARTAIIQALTQGQDYVVYTGHASAQGFTGEYMWHKTYVESTKYLHKPLWMLATCDTYAFDRLDDGIAERMLYARDGGAIAVVGACRTVYADSNYILSLELADAYSRTRGHTTIGEIYNRARNATVQRNELNLRVNTMCYNLAGDPEVPYYSPDLVVETSSINGNDPSAADPSLYPLANNVVEGSIVDDNGNLQSDFNGAITITLYDGPEKIMSSPKDGKSNPREVVLDETLLSEYTTTVKNGRFRAEFAFPLPSRTDSINRLTFYAVNNVGDAAGVGIVTNAKIQAYDAAKRIDDTTAPVIEACYLNIPDFADGDEVDAQPTFFARISDSESGVNMLVNALRAGVSLTLDDTKSLPNVRNSMSMLPDGTVEIELPITDLSDGRHSLTLNLSDIVGNRSSATLNFVVVNRAAEAQLLTDAEAVREQVTFDIKHTFSGEPTGRLVVEDAAGNVVYSRGNCSFPYVWDLKDNSGNPVADGHYRCYAALRSDRVYGHTPGTDLVVIK